MIVLAADAATWVAAVAALVVGLATIALVWVTRTLGTATDRLVEATDNLRMESIADRQLSVYPALVIDLRFWAEYVFVDLYNAGQGPALDVDLTLTWRPRAGHDDQLLGDAQRIWRTKVLPPGARHTFNPPAHGGTLMKADELSAHVEAIVLRGTTLDHLGATHEVESDIADFRDAVKTEKAAQRLSVPAAPEERLAYFVEEIAGKLNPS